MFKRKRTLFPILMVIMLALQMMSPVTVLADDGTPPPIAESHVTTEETSTSENDAVTSAEEIPVPDETTPTPETTDSATETAPMAEPETEADLTVAEALEQAPEGTDLVVVNEEGELEPLATEEAAEIVAEADPIWCSDGTTPTTINSAAHCSPSYTTMTELLIWLTANNPNVAGTIWIEKTYDSAAEDVAGFTLDGTVLTNMANNSLTIQGGWDGLETTTVDTTSPSTFSGDYLHIINWNEKVTLNDIAVDGTTNNGVEISTTGDINIDNVTSSNNTNGYGLVAQAGGDIVVSNITANNNFDNGAYLKNCAAVNCDGTSTNTVTVNGTNQFNDNPFVGLRIYSDGEITINNVTATGNRTGVYLDNSGTNFGITINGGKYCDNTGSADLALSPGNAANINGPYFANHSRIKLSTGVWGSVDAASPCPVVVSTPPTASPITPIDSEPVLPVNEVSALDGPVELLDCSEVTGTEFSLPDGGGVFFPCPIQGTATVTPLEPETIPEIPEGVTLHSVISVSVTQNGIEVEELPEPITITFAPISNNSPGTNNLVLHRQLNEPVWTVLDLIETVNTLVIAAKDKIDQIQQSSESISIGDMFEMQMMMNRLAQLSEMSTNVVSATHSGVYSMSRNTKGGENFAQAGFMLRNIKDIVEGESKKLQTTINQANITASQQANTATAILQELSDILNLIYK